jgi:hypothetical protein
MADLQAMNIVIGANVSQATQGLNTVSQSLAQTATAAVKVDSSIGKIGASSYTTRFAVQNMANVFRDLPYAINNPAIGATVLDHVLGSVNALKEETGSLKGAFGALAGSLTGTGGVLVALNLLGAAVSFFANSSHEAKKETDDFGKSASSEIATLRTLEAVATDTNNSYAARKKAVDELQKLYPSYLGNIKDEAILNGDAAKAINDVALALAKKAFFEASEKTLTDLADKQLKAQRDELDLIGKVEQAELDLAKARVEEKKAASAPLPIGGSTFGGGGAAPFQTTTAVDQAAQALKAAKDALDANRKSQQGLNNDFQYYLNIAERYKAQSISLDPDPNGKVHEHLKKIKDDIQDIQLIPQNRLGLQKQWFDQIAVQTASIHDLITKTLDKGPSLSTRPFVPNLEPTKEQLAEISKITDLVTASFDSLFSTIAGGGDVFSAIEKSLKQLLIKLVQTVVEAAVLSVILNAVMPDVVKLNPGIFSFANEFKSLLHLATGGVVTRPTLALVGEQGPERITPLNQISNSGNNIIAGEVVFTISGQNLRGTLRRADNTANNIYGN